MGEGTGQAGTAATGAAVMFTRVESAGEFTEAEAAAGRYLPEMVGPRSTPSAPSKPQAEVAYRR